MGYIIITISFSAIETLERSQILSIYNCRFSKKLKNVDDTGEQIPTNGAYSSFLSLASSSFVKE